MTRKKIEPESMRRELPALSEQLDIIGAQLAGMLQTPDSARNLPAVRPAVERPMLPARLSDPERPRPPIPSADAPRAIVKGVCLVEQREWWAVFRLNRHNQRFYFMESTALGEPTDPRALGRGQFAVSELHLSGIACPVCANSVVASACAYRPPLSCVPSADAICPGICRQLFGSR
jgi:hypothetical protein